MTDDKIADDIISTLEKLRAENPGDFMAVAEMRNAVLEEAAQVADAHEAELRGIVYKAEGDAISVGHFSAIASEAGSIAKAIRSLKSGGKNA